MSRQPHLRRRARRRDFGETGRDGTDPSPARHFHSLGSARRRCREASRHTTKRVGVRPSPYRDRGQRRRGPDARRHRRRTRRNDDEWRRRRTASSPSSQASDLCPAGSQLGRWGAAPPTSDLRAERPQQRQRRAILHNRARQEHVPSCTLLAYYARQGLPSVTALAAAAAARPAAARHFQTVKSQCQ